MNKILSIIVFTKNRPLQLHGYLESIYRFFSADFMQVYILYKPELFSEEYESVFQTFADCIVITETNFHKDFMEIFSRIQTDYILFGVDDVVYYNSFEIDVIEKTFEQLGNRLFGFSLRLDKRQMTDDITAGNVKEYSISGDTIYSVDWTKGKTPNTRYPFELCATIYRTEDLQKLFENVVSKNQPARKLFSPGSTLIKIYSKLFNSKKLLKKFGFFYNPNTLESWCCRYVQRNPMQFGNLLNFKKICASAIQVNMVNTRTSFVLILMQL